jgi:hypothetical protein
MILLRFSMMLALALGLMLIVGCDSSTDSDDEETEFVAELNDFENYTSWTLVASENGPDPLLQTAHGVGDTLTRNIYFKDDETPGNGRYPKGTMIVKELRDEDGNLTGALTMMVKRGGDFNPDGNGWEWFMTSTDLSTVMTQGNNATAGGGMCANCHSGANTNNNGTDWVFSRD